jgi:7-carboxy-7-deazaguanine synthase
MSEHLIDTPEHTLVINEIFHSIQGESSHAGRRCVFIRLTYCNIRCTYCDTPYAFYEGRQMTIDEIMADVSRHACKLVEVTGGEPMFQSNVHELLDRLVAGGFEVLLETGGSLSLARVDPAVKKIVDFKCPTSGMEKKNLWSIVDDLHSHDEVKFVIGSREDYEWCKQKIEEHQLDKRCDLLMSVVFGVMEPLTLAEWVLADRLDVRFQLQMHKFIWAPETRGV